MKNDLYQLQKTKQHIIISGAFTLLMLGNVAISMHIKDYEMSAICALLGLADSYILNNALKKYRDIKSQINESGKQDKIK